VQEFFLFVLISGMVVCRRDGAFALTTGHGKARRGQIRAKVVELVSLAAGR
jgi:hypothetical protein